MSQPASHEQIPPGMPTEWAVDTGQWVSAADVRVELTDPDFVNGSCVTERLRTFGGIPFRGNDHLDRLERSLAVWGMSLPVAKEQFQKFLSELVAKNQPEVGSPRDCGLLIVVLPVGAADSSTMRWMIRTTSLDFQAHHRVYEAGDHLVVSQTVRQIPPECWPAHLKCRSRTHYALADREARRMNPRARGLVLNLDGTVSECGIANIVLVTKRGEFVSPPFHRILPGISLSVVAEIVRSMDLAWIERDILPEELGQATEIFLTSTNACVWPVCQLDGRPVGTGRPGQNWKTVIDRWSNDIGLNLLRQARVEANSSQ